MKRAPLQATFRTDQIRRSATVWMCGLLVASITANAQNMGLVAHYSFDGENLALDSTTNGYHGINRGGQPVVGVQGNAVSLDGRSGITVEEFRDYNWGSQFSVSLWFKREGGWQEYAPLVNAGVTEGSSWEINMGRERGGTAVWAGVCTFDHPYPNDIRDVFARQQQWHHAVMTYDGSRLYFYLDGVLTATGDGKDQGEIVRSDHPLRIGTSFWNTRHGYFIGAIDEVRLYNRKLSRSEVKELFAVLERENQVPENERPTDVPPVAPEPSAVPTRLERPPLVASSEASAPPPVHAPMPSVAEPDAAENVLAAIEAAAVDGGNAGISRNVPPAEGDEACCAQVQRWLELWKDGHKQEVIDEWNRLTR